MRSTVLAACLLLSACLAVPGTAPAAPDAETAAKPTLMSRVTDAAALARLSVIPSENGYSGDGWERLIADGAQAQFLLIGEEHGIAENPELAAALFEALVPHGYRHIAVEVSPFMASLMDDRLAEGGLEGLAALFGEPGGTPAFFGMREEAEMLARIRALLPDEPDVIWGTDYEILGDRQMLSALEAMDKPSAASAALAALRTANGESWARYEETRNPGLVFSFAGDPQLVRDVEAAWPGRSDRAAWILDQIEDTLEINRLFVTGDNFGSNLRRANGLRENFLRHWRDHAGSDEPPRVMAKFGASHLMRGRNSNGVFDLGTTLPELAALEGREALSILVLPGPGSSVAVMDPTTLTTKPGPARGGYGRGLEPFYASVLEDGYTLFDLRPLRALARHADSAASAATVETIHGFDYLLVMNGSTPSSNF